MTGDQRALRAATALCAVQKALPQHLLSRSMHALARSRQPCGAQHLIRTVLRSYPQIDMHEALQPDPFVYRIVQCLFHAGAAARRAADRGGTDARLPRRWTAR